MDRGAEDVQGGTTVRDAATVHTCRRASLSPRDTESDPTADCTLGTMVSHQGLILCNKRNPGGARWW